MGEPTTIHINEDPDEWTLETHRAFIALMASRLMCDPTRTGILDRVNALVQPGSVRSRYVDICPDCSNCYAHHKDGCRLEWEEMTVMEIEDDGKVLGDEDECRVCECGIAWIAVRCDVCRAEADRYEAGSMRYHEAKDDAIS